MSITGTTANQVYDQFYAMIDSLCSSIQAGESGGQINANDQKIYEFAKEWVKFCHQNQSAIVEKLGQKKSDLVDPVLTQIKLIDKEVGSISAESIDTADAASHLQQLQLMLMKMNDILKTLRGEPKNPASSLSLIELNKDVLIETIRKLPNLIDLVRVGTLCNKTRNIILDVPTWKRNLAFKNLVENPDASELRKQFLDILKLYHGDRSHKQKAHQFASAIAAEFFNTAGYLPLKSFLTEANRPGRELVHKILKDQDLSKKQGLWLSYISWIKDEPLNLKFFLAKCPNLSLLVVSGNNSLHDRDLHPIANLANLSTFICSKCGSLKGEALNHWVQGNNLEFLDISNCEDFEAKYLTANLPKFTNLKKLKISTLKLKDEDLGPLPKLTKLEVLDLSGNQALTDKTLTVLSQMPALKEVNLKGVKGITLEGLLQLRSALPGLDIQHDLA